MPTKNYLNKNAVPLVFSAFIVLGLLMTKETPYNLLNDLVQGFIGYALLAIALLIPIKAGMGFNFSIGIGAIAGQLGLMMALNWELSGLLGILVAVAFATFFAILAGVLTGMVLDKANGQEMIASYFIGYIGNGVNQLILLGLVGSGILLTSTKLLSGNGEGIKSTIDLNGSLFRALDGILEIKLFLLIIIMGILIVFLSAYRLKSNKRINDKLKSTVIIVVSSVMIGISGVIMFVEALPVGIKQLSNVKFPLITGAIICGVVIVHGMINRTKFGLDLTGLSAGNQNKSDAMPLSSKIRIVAIIISTLLAAWGQIILLQNTGLLSTYTSHAPVAMLSVLALIVGGATFRKASITNALLGVFLLQGFYVIVLPVISDKLSESGAEIFRTILFNGAMVYALVTTWGKNERRAT